MSGRRERAGCVFAGRVTPVTHYTMGGVRVDGDGRVVRNEASARRRRARKWCSEKESPSASSSGGVHGANRLGGNALTECAVFGRRAGMAVPLPARGGDGGDAREAKEDGEGRCEGRCEGRGEGRGEGREDAPPAAAATVTRAELARHASEDDCWTALYGEVYDFTDFLEDHPAGAEAITRFAGTDGTRGSTPCTARGCSRSSWLSGAWSIETYFFTVEVDVLAETLETLRGVAF